MDTVKITSAITGNDPGLVCPVLWKQKSVKVEKGRIRTIRGEKEMMRGTVDSTQEGNKKMRSYLKILIATVLVGIACFAGAKEVKANIFYDEDSAKLSWTDPSVGITKVTVGELEISVTSGTTEVELAIDQIKEALGGTLSAGEKEITVTTLSGADTKETKVVSINVYTHECSVNPTGSASIGSYSKEYGLKGDIYSATCVPAAEYMFVKWSDENTSLTNDNLKFGTAYTATLSKVPSFVRITPTTLNGGEVTTATVILDSATADTSLLSFDVDPDLFTNCSASYSPSSTDPSQIVFSDVKGNGTFSLDIYYGLYWHKTVEMTVTTPVTGLVIVGEPSMQVGETENYEVVLTPEAAEGSFINWSGINTNVVSDYKYDDGSIDLTGLKVGSTDLKATVNGESTTVKIYVVEDEDVETVEIVSGPVEVVAGKTGTYKAKVTLSNGKASKYGVAWSVDDPTVATITSTDKLTGKLTAKKEGSVTVRATAIGDPTMYYEIDVDIVDKIDVGTLIYKAADGSDTITFTKPSGDAKYTLDLSWGKGVTSDHPDASVKSISYKIVSGDTGVGTFSGSVFTPKKAGTITVEPTITYTDGEKVPADQVDITVVDNDWTTKLSTGGSSNSSSVSSDYYIGFKLESDEVYSSYDPKYDLEELTGYRVEVLKDGKVLAGKTVTPSSFSVGETYKISKDTLEDLLEDASGDLSGDSTTVTFRVSPYGTNLNRAKAYATSAARSLERTVYKNGSTYYLTKDSSSSSSSSMKSSSGQGSGSGSDYDKVPKTGEGNTRLLIIMIAVISATIAGSILLSNLPVRSKSGADESVDDKDVFHKKD